MPNRVGEVSAELRALPIAGICQHHSDRNLLFHRLPNLLQRNLWLGLKHDPFGNARLTALFRIGLERRNVNELSLQDKICLWNSNLFHFIGLPPVSLNFVFHRPPIHSIGKLCKIEFRGPAVVHHSPVLRQPSIWRLVQP